MSVVNTHYSNQNGRMAGILSNSKDLHQFILPTSSPAKKGKQKPQPGGPRAIHPTQSIE